MAETVKKFKVFLDPGHGGNDPGAVKYLREEDVNLVEGLACRDYLEAHDNVEVKMSRTTDKNTDIYESCAEANEWGADIAVSFHNNAGGGDGSEVYYSIYVGVGKELAKNIEAELKKLGQNSRGIKTRRGENGDYYAFIRCTKMPAVVCEGCFVDNKTDVKICDTVAEQKEFGYAYARAILKTLGIKDKGYKESSASSTKKTTSSTKSTATSTEKKLTVSQYQKNLKHYYGYYTGTVDGKKGKKTTEAIKAFQKAKGLTVDGVYGAKTDAKLKSVVKSLQKKLGVTQDGKIGTKTIAAIKAVQKKYGLTQDGIAGKKTFAALNGQLKIPAKTTTKKTSTTKAEKKEEKKETMYSEHFARSEFKCKCGGKYCDGYPVEMNKKLINILEELREYYGGKPVSIRSGIRCKKHNANVGGVSNSTHRNGKAADIYISGICDTAAGRNKVVKKAYALGAKYAYCNTPGMGTSVHINV